MVDLANMTFRQLIEITEIPINSAEALTARNELHRRQVIAEQCAEQCEECKEHVIDCICDKGFEGDY